MSEQILRMAVDLATAQIARTAVPTSHLPELVETIFATLCRLQSGGKDQKTPKAKPAQPTIPLDATVSTNRVVCMECGHSGKILRRHLMSAHGMTEGIYKAKWGLPSDHPIVAPSYSKFRRSMAKDSGLGRKTRARAR